MGLSGRIRILPLLVFVAMLAFSVRLVEVVYSISSVANAVPGSAYAADEMSHDEGMHEDGMGMAAEDSMEGEASKDVEQLDTAGPTWRGPADEDPGYSSVKMEIFDDLAARRKELEQRERALVTREALLKATQQEIERKYQELSRLKKEIEALLDKQSTEEQDRIKSLVKVYEGMKPKDAARIFDTLDLDILVSVVAQMSERKLSPVLAAMDPERARTVTIMLAEQKSLPDFPRSN